MIVSFVYLTTNQNGDEHLGTASIAAYLEKHKIPVKLKIITFTPGSYVIDDIIDQLPKDIDIIGFPIFTTNAKLIYELSSVLKNRFPKLLISVGGPLATDAREIILKDCTDIDFIVLGDGEEPYLEVVKALQKEKDIKNINSILTRYDEKPEEKQANITNIQELPWMSRQYLKQMIDFGFGTARISTSRGCCANCSFCSHNNYTKHKGKQWRGRDIKDVFEEIIFIHQKYNITSFTFNDGSFEDPGELGKERIKTFCEMVVTYPHKLHFWCFLRADTFKQKDLPLIQLMRKAGFTEVFIGVESQNEEDLKFYNKRANVQQNRDSLRLFQQNGINVLFGFIIFSPVTSSQSLKENYLFLKEVKNWRPHAYIGRMAIYYKTAMHFKCKELGLLTDDFSYINPMGYKFADSKVNEIWDFIEKYLIKSVVFEKYDFDLFYFNNYFHDFLALFPDETNVYQPEYESIMNEAADVLSDYFYDLFFEKDFNRAKRNIGVFESNMAKVILKMNSLKIKMMLNEPYKSYIQKFYNGNKKSLQEPINNIKKRLSK